MRFQVLSSTFRYSHPYMPGRRGVAVDFDVFPSELGELKFSDGNRLLGCDLSENWGEPLTIGLLSRKLKDLGYKGIDENKFWPIRTTVSVTDEDWRTGPFLKDAEFGCGFASYSNYENAHTLRFLLSVEKDVFRDLLQARLDLGGRMMLDISVGGLSDRDRGDPDSLSGTWDLDDKSDCGDGRYRIVERFSLERETPHFSRDPQTERTEAARVEDKREIEKLLSLLNDVVAIETGTVDGANAKLLRLNFFATSVLVFIGILVLLHLYL